MPDTHPLLIWAWTVAYIKIHIGHTYSVSKISI
jgi:hypothetical protein